LSLTLELGKRGRFAKVSIWNAEHDGISVKVVIVTNNSESSKIHSFGTHKPFPPYVGQTSTSSITISLQKNHTWTDRLLYFFIIPCSNR